jgi:diguanylate cyclase (GGDEF)-like protein
VLAAIGGAAAAGIGHFRSGTDRARQTEFVLAEAQSAANAANAAEWKMIARRHADPVEAAAFAHYVAAIQSRLQAVADSDRSSAPVARQVSLLLDRYGRAAAAELSALDRGDVPRASEVDDRRVDPLFGKIDGTLAQAIATTEVRRARAEAHAILAARVIVISAALGMLIAIALFARAQRRVLLTELERARLRSEADHDELTGLLNRRGFFASLRETITGRNRVAVLLLDLDGFKEINDTLGHAAGDTLLRQIGLRLGAALRDGDKIARLGGDEFAILVDAAGTTAHDASEIGRRIRATLTSPFEIGRLSLQVRASVGVALFPEHGTTPEELLRQADIAMYQAKQNHIGFAVYASSADPRGGQTLQLSS